MKMKVHSRQGEKIVALCDKELLGKVLKEGETVLDLENYREFYEGEEASVEEVKEQLKDASSANLVGKKAVGVALGMGLAKEEDVKNIESVPHLQVYRIPGE